MYTHKYRYTRNYYYVVSVKRTTVVLLLFKKYIIYSPYGDIYVTSSKSYSLTLTLTYHLETVLFKPEFGNDKIRSFAEMLLHCTSQYSTGTLAY